MRESLSVGRRLFVSRAMAGVSGTALAVAQGAMPSWWRFFTNHEAGLVDALAEQIIPRDTDPGAHDAGAVNFIDKQLVGHYRQFKEPYRRGLLGVEESASAMFDKGFLSLSWNQQTNVLTVLEAGTAPGKTWQAESSSRFFRLVRDHVMQGFYGSPRHGGNRGYASYQMLGVDYPQIIGRST